MNIFRHPICILWSICEVHTGAQTLALRHIDFLNEWTSVRNVHRVVAAILTNAIPGAGRIRCSLFSGNFITNGKHRNKNIEFSIAEKHTLLLALYDFTPQTEKFNVCVEKLAHLHNTHEQAPSIEMVPRASVRSRQTSPTQTVTAIVLGICTYVYVPYVYVKICGKLHIFGWIPTDSST